MDKKKKTTLPRPRKFVVLLSNNTDHRDDDSVEVMAKSSEEAKEKAKYDSTRFSIRGVYLKADL